MQTPPTIYRNDINKSERYIVGGVFILKYVILGTIIKSPLTGYDIRKYIELGVGMFYKASSGSIYPWLNKLEKEGLVSCEERMEGKRVKKWYSIREEGKKEFFEWLATADMAMDLEMEMVKIYFYDSLPDEKASQHIQEHKERLIAYREQLYHQREEIAEMMKEKGYYYKLSTLYYGIKKLDSMIAWCEVIEQKKDLDTLL